MKRLNRYITVSPETLRQWEKEGKKFVLLDVLTPEHHAEVHIPGARNACVFQVTFLDQMHALFPGKDQVIVVYGSSERSRDAVTAAEKLCRAGYANVVVLEAGIAAWRESGYPLDGEQAGRPADREKGLKIEDGTYRVNTSTSLIEWRGRNPNTTHHGTLQLFEGAITVRDGVIGGSFEIDMTSIRNINLEGDALQPVLVSHLQSDDFFFVKMFPRARFRITRVAPVKKPNWSTPNFRVRGSLELRGIKKEIEFQATVNPLPEGAASVEAHFDIDRTRWGVIYGSSRFFEHLGMHLVFDLISIQLRLVLEGPRAGHAPLSG